MDHPVTCEDARRLLWPDPDRSAPVAAREHVEECPACRAFFACDRAMAARLHALPRPAAPPAVWAAVRRIAADRQTRRPWRRWAGVGLAAAATVALALGLRSRERSAAMTAPFAAQAATVGIEPLAMTTASHDSLGAWLSVRLGTPVAIPAISDAELVGGAVTTINGRPSALAQFSMHGDALTYFALPVAQLDGDTPGKGILLRARGEYVIAVWREPGGVRAVAARMPRETIRAVAAECRNKALMSG